MGSPPLAATICYEAIFPGAVLPDGPRPELILNVTNDAWFGDSTEPWIHLALSKFRAIEQRRFLVRSTNSGVSAIVDPVGRIVTHTGTFREEATRGEIAYLKGGTPYRLWGDVPWWLATMAVAVMSVRRRAPRRALVPPTA